MSTQSVSNNYNTPLIAAASFVGVDESSSDSLTISVFLASPTLGLLTIKQSNSRDGPYQLTDTFNYGLSVLDSMQVYRVPSGFSFFHVEFTNAEGNQTYLSLNTYLERTYQETSVDITNIVDISGSVVVTNVVDISGSVVVTSQPHLSYLTDNIAVATMPAITGTVAVSSQPHLSYLTDNVAVATMPAITGTVAVSSQPHLSYLTDNVAVATQPALTFANDKVDVTGSSITVSSQPHLSYLTDNVAVATMPSITGTVSVSSQPHLSYLTDNVAVATQPALAFSTDKVDVTGSSVTVTAMPTTVSYRTTTAGNTGLVVKASAGIVARIYISNYDVTNNAYLYVRLYDKATAATSADTPLCCFDLPHRGNTNASRIMLDLDNLSYTNGLSIRATTGSNADNDVVVTGLASDISIFYK